MTILKEKFYKRDANQVAEDLLGKLVVRETSEDRISGHIVETEAYHGKEDPASRAAQDGETEVTEVMWGKPARVFIYMVHGHWMFNIVTGEDNEPSAVLIRAIKPESGLDIMRENREKEKIDELCSGPGKLTQAMRINKSLNRSVIYREEELYIREGDFSDFEVGRSKRIGVTEDLEEPLRFYIRESSFTSR